MTACRAETLAATHPVSRTTRTAGDDGLVSQGAISAAAAQIAAPASAPLRRMGMRTPCTVRLRDPAKAWGAAVAAGRDTSRAWPAMGTARTTHSQPQPAVQA